MKILKIELQNINSLKCEAPIVIDFEHQRFEDVGLFAITGSTGAGKTTLLDAITIALYRRVARFEKSSSNAKLEDVVSYGAATAMARVTFETQNYRYEAQWDIRLMSNSGKILSKPVENVRLKNLSNEKIIAETKTGCDEKIVEISQLNYDQFLRSVLLAQGEFAAFLSAKNSEKGLLLQQIAGDEIYRKIGETLKNRIADEKKILEQIKSNINTNDLLNDDEIKLLNDEKEKNIEILNVLNDDLKKVDVEIKWFENKAKVENKKLEIIEDKQQLEIDASENANVFQLLKKNDIAEPIKVILTEVTRLETEIENKIQRLQTIDSELELLKVKLDEATIFEANCKLIVSEKVQQSIDWQPKLDKVVDFDADIRSQKTLFFENEKTKEEIANTISEFTQSIEKKNYELRLYETNVERLRVYFEQNRHIPTIEKYQSNWNTQLTKRKSNWERIIELKRNIEKEKNNFQNNQGKITEIENNKVSDNKIFDALTSEIKTLTELLAQLNIENLLEKSNLLNNKKNQLRDLIQLASKNNELVEGTKKLTHEASTNILKSNELAKEIKDIDTNILAVTQLVKDAEELFEKDSYIVSLEAERKKLKQSEPCALCGSTEHPLVQKYTELEISESKKRVDERKSKLLKLIDDKRKCEIEQTKITVNIDNIQLQIEKNKNEISTIKFNFETLNTNLKIENIEDLERSLHSIEKEHDNLKKTIFDSQNLQKEKNKKEDVLKAIETKLTSYKLQLIQINTSNNGIAENIVKEEEDCKTLQSENNETERLLVAQLADCELQIPEHEQATQFIDQINRIVKSYNDNLREHAEIKNAIKNCISDKENLNNLLNEKTLAHTKLSDTTAKLVENLTDLIEKRKTILPLETTIETKRAQLQQIIETAQKAETDATLQLNILKKRQIEYSTEKKNSETEKLKSETELKNSLYILTDKIQESNFQNRKEVTEALLPEDTKQQYSKIWKAIENRRISIEAVEKSIISEIEKLEKESINDCTIEETNKKFTEITEKNNQLLTRLGEITESFRKDNEIKTRNASVVKEIKNQEAIYHKWTTLMTLLGGSQDALNTYVQRLTLKNLIDLANLHLFKLNQRYSLHLNTIYKQGEELNFKLVDHYQADEPRLVETSSGGEKFLISLSLALGLSDLASHNVSIGSLFIDEGFGTLDSNTLETVISTLETLKVQGKTIGIISHVDSLKERIPVQIQVLKKSNGVSIVEIV